jgi:hypothetical protein
MPIVRGREEVKRFLDSLPKQIEDKLLRGAGRAGANVVADEARLRSISPEVTAAIGVKVSTKDGTILAKVRVKGPGAYIAPWLEYGTDPHFISVSADQRNGMTVGRINRVDKAARRAGTPEPGRSLKIGGSFVGGTVHHPGAQAHPFLRPALDTKEAEAIAAAQSYINARVKPSGIIGAVDQGDDE